MRTTLSLLHSRELQLGKKSDLLDILVNDVQYELPSFVDVKLLDGAAVVHLLPSTSAVTFNEYADQIFLPHTAKQLESCTRIDVVYDAYLPNSIKQSAREKRGKGICRKVSGNNKLPGKWTEFLSKNYLNLFPENLQIGIVLLTSMLPLHLALQSSLRKYKVNGIM